MEMSLNRNSLTTKLSFCFIRKRRKRRASLVAANSRLTHGRLSDSIDLVSRRSPPPTRYATFAFAPITSIRFISPRPESRLSSLSFVLIFSNFFSPPLLLFLFLFPYYYFLLGISLRLPARPYRSYSFDHL